MEKVRSRKCKEAPFKVEEQIIRSRPNRSCMYPASLGSSFPGPDLSNDRLSRNLILTTKAMRRDPIVKFIDIEHPSKEVVTSLFLTLVSHAWTARPHTMARM